MDLPTKVWLANEIRIWGLAVTAIIGAISFVATWTHSRWQAELAIQKEEASEVTRRASDERIATAQEAAARANERAAELANEAAQAKLRLEQLRARLEPRSLDPAAFAKALEGQPKAPVQVLYLRDDWEAYQLAEFICWGLKVAKWDCYDFAPTPLTNSKQLATRTVGAGSFGLSVAVRLESKQEAALLKDIGTKEFVPPQGSILGPASALAKTIISIFNLVNMGGADASLPLGTVRIVVGPKT